MKTGEVLLIALAGGSASGKTTLTSELARQWGDQVATLSYDEYYILRRNRQGREVDEEGPDVFDNEAFLRDLKLLKAGYAIEIESNSRETTAQGITRRRVEPRPIVLVEGYLLLHDPEAREQFDHTFFVNIPEEEMVRRRVQRRDPIHPNRHDTDEYIANTMLPGYRRYVLPQRQYADVILDGMQPTTTLAQQVRSYLRR